MSIIQSLTKGQPIFGKNLEGLVMPIAEHLAKDTVVGKYVSRKEAQI